MHKELIAYISQLYNIGELTQISGEVTTGALTISTVLSNGTDRFFLKQYKENFTEDRVKDVHHAKLYFSEGGIPVILPILNSLGMTYFAYGGFLYALFPFVIGVHKDRNDMSTKALESMANMLGKIHILGKNPPFKISANFKTWDKTTFIDKADKIIEIIEDKKEQDEFDVLALKNITTKKELVEKAHNKVLADYNIGKPHLIHGDYHDHNVFFNEKDEVTNVFDFEKADMSPRTYELVRSMNFTCLDGPITEERLKNAVRYLQSYNEAYPITKAEFKEGLEVYYMKTIHSLWVVEEYYISKNLRPSIFLRNNMELLFYFKDHMKELEDRLLTALK